MSDQRYSNNCCVAQKLPSRKNFRAYSYMSERFVAADSDDPLFAWPPFMVAQSNVLGKNYPYLRAPFENPQVDEAKAFEALT
jgi:hypothetical protein